MKAVLKIVTLILPVLVPGLLIGVHISNREAGQNWRIAVEGYDPRDLLRGHYLQFRYDWNWDEAPGSSCEGDHCAICLEASNASDNRNPRASMMTLAEAEQQCESFVAGAYREGTGFRIGNGPGHGLRRYYIPEARAEELDELLRNAEGSSHSFEVGLTLDGSGQAVMDQMYLDGIPLEEWLELNP